MRLGGEGGGVRFCPGSYGHRFPEARGDGELAAVQENRGDECGDGGEGWVSRADGGANCCDFWRAELAGSGVGEIRFAEMGDGGIEVGSGKG